MRILLLFDLDECPDEQEYSDDLITEEWESEAGVLRALEALGHEVKLFGISSDLAEIINVVRGFNPDVVFNLAEAFRRERALEPNIAGVLEALGTRFTGASSKALQICKDKALTKGIVAHHFSPVAPVRVRVPRFALSPRGRPLRELEGFPFPALVKPVGLESSAGISRESLVWDVQAGLERVRYVHEKLGQDVIIEEYVEGRELYVSVLGRWDGEMIVMPAREMFFDTVPPGGQKFATFKAKWDDAYRARWGIRNGFARSLSSVTLDALNNAGREIYRALQIVGYARIDLRLTPAGELVFLEANPNPSISPKDDFARSALKAGMKYDQLISQILRLARGEALAPLTTVHSHRVRSRSRQTGARIHLATR